MIISSSYHSEYSCFPIKLFLNIENYCNITLMLQTASYENHFSMKFMLGGGWCSANKNSNFFNLNFCFVIPNLHFEVSWKSDCSKPPEVGR